MDSAVVAAGDTVTAAERNLIRKDILTNAGQLVTTTGSANSYIATLDNQLAIADMVAGVPVRIKINATNTSVSTLRIDDGAGTLLAATAIKKNGNVDVGPGDLVNGTCYLVWYDGTYIQLLNHNNPPSGTIAIWGAASAPTGWVLCDGSSLTRADYAGLFAAISTTYGAADGSHFNVPNLKGKVPVGFDSGQTEFDALGETGGEKTHTMVEAEIAAHSHTITGSRDGGSSGGTHVGGFAQTTNDGTLTNGASGAAIGTTGSGTPFNVLQPYMALHYIIKT